MRSTFDMQYLRVLEVHCTLLYPNETDRIVPKMHSRISEHGQQALKAGYKDDW
jgi:hypothetical protein